MSSGGAGGLSLIAGTVSELVLHEGEEEFVRSSNQQAAGVGAAMGLAAAGMAGAAVSASIAAGSAGDAVQFFSCKVGDKPIQGRFSKTTFKDGDQVEVVVEPNGSRRCSTLAVRRNKDHLLWMVPHCSRGVRAHGAFATRMFPWIFLGFPFFSLSTYWAIDSWGNHNQVGWYDLRFMGAICFSIGALAAIYYPIRFYKQWRPIAQQAERIFAALGYPDPSRVDLPRDHKKYCKANGIKWPYLSDGPWIYHYLDPRERR